MKWIISNHKNALDESLVCDYAKKLDQIKLNNINLIICPKDEHLKYFDGTNYSLGCQDVNLSFEVMNNYNVKFSIVGHSYIRQKYNETNELINKKIKELIDNDIVPILCIGEDVNSDLENILKIELEDGLKGVNGKVIIAYEPVWAIGSGVIPNIDILKEVIAFIDLEATKILKEKPIILYGGSVNSETISLLEELEELDGYLIGGASLDIEKLKKLIEVIK